MSSGVGDDLADREIRCQEVLVRPGDRVSVFGRARMRWIRAGRATSRDPPMLNHITGSRGAPVIVAQEPVLIVDEKDPVT